MFDGSKREATKKLFISRKIHIFQWIVFLPPGLWISEGMVSLFWNQTVRTFTQVHIQKEKGNVKGIFGGCFRAALHYIVSDKLPWQVRAGTEHLLTVKTRTTQYRYCAAKRRTRCGINSGKKVRRYDFGTNIRRASFADSFHHRWWWESMMRLDTRASPRLHTAAHMCCCASSSIGAFLQRETRSMVLVGLVI